MLRHLLMFFMVMPLFGNADLLVSNVQTASTSVPPWPDGSVEVTFVVRNIGNQPAYNFAIAGYSNKAQNCSSGLRLESRATVSRLDPGSQIVGTYQVNSLVGDLVLYAVVKADVDNVVIENNESNNCLTSFQVTVKNPDMRVLSTAPPSPFKIVPGGESLPLFSTVYNYGTADTGWPCGSSHNRFFISTALSNPPSSAIISASNAVPSLVINERYDSTASISVPTSYPLGTYNLFVKADGNNEVFENREDNNFSSPITVQVVDTCTLADVNNSGSVDILDLIMLVNGAVSLVSPSNEYLNLRRSPAPFPELINREDFLFALPCFGNFQFNASASGALQDFSVSSTGSGNYRLDLNLSGSVSAISAFVVKPGGKTIALNNISDLLASGYTQLLQPDPGSLLVANEFHATTHQTRALGFSSFASFHSEFDMTKLRQVSSQLDFDAGIAVQVTFGDGSRAVLMKRFDYILPVDPLLQSHLEQVYQLAPGTMIPASLTTNTHYLDLQGLGLESLEGIQFFRSLETVDANFNQLTSLPDLSRVSSLTHLFAAYNQIDSLDGLPSGLAHLQLSHNQLGQVPSLAGLLHLSTLDVSYNDLYSIPDLTPFTELKSLNISANQIAALPALPASLDNLSAYDNRISKLPLLSGQVFYFFDMHDNYLYDVGTLTPLNWTANAYLLLYGNNLDSSDCGHLWQLKQKVTEFLISPQRMVEEPCIFLNDL